MIMNPIDGKLKKNDNEAINGKNNKIKLEAN